MTREEAGVGTIRTRAITAADLPAVSRLLDATLGPGYWSLDHGVCGSHRVAELDGTLAGVASAVLLDEPLAAAPDLPGPVGLLRIVAVSEEARGRGIATRLAEEACEGLEWLGAREVAAFAWVYERTGAAPLAGVLERLGFSAVRRLEGFYAGGAPTPCLGCGQTHCVCPADLYVRPAVG
jgi:GNAT superfamily N-acetyltransferase